MLKSLIFSHFDKNLIMLDGFFLAHWRCGTFINTLPECGLLLHRQGIGGEVVEACGKENLKVFAPFFLGQGRDAINQIEGNFLKTSFFCPFQDLQRVL